MFDVSPDKIVLVLFIAVLVLGPARLAEAARALGRARAHLRRWSSELSPDTAKLIRDPRRALLDALAEPAQAIADTAAAAKQSLTEKTDHEGGDGTR
jgi:Sec-independent protein translocase protein TatA